MKKILLSGAILFFVTVCHAQKPRKTEVKDAKDRYANQEVAYRKVALNGKILYQKGDCTSLGPRSKTCTFCDNAELTQNCREYECDNKGWPIRLKTATSVVAEKATTNERPKPEDPDQGGEIFKKSRKKVKQ